MTRNSDCRYTECPLRRRRRRQAHGVTAEAREACKCWTVKMKPMSAFRHGKQDALSPLCSVSIMCDSSCSILDRFRRVCSERHPTTFEIAYGCCTGRDAGRLPRRNQLLAEATCRFCRFRGCYWAPWVFLLCTLLSILASSRGCSPTSSMPSQIFHEGDSVIYGLRQGCHRWSRAETGGYCLCLLSATQGERVVKCV